MSFTQATSADLEGIYALETVGFEAWEQWSKQSWGAEIGRDLRSVLLNRTATTIDAAAAFSVLAETAELLRVVVAPAAQGNGLGKSLVTAGKQWAKQAGAQRMMLEVRHDNEPGLSVYRATGFVPIAHRNDYYGTGRHAVVMECQL